MEVLKELNKYKDNEYAKLQSKIIPNIDSKLVIGVRVPAIRKIAKTYINDKECELFLRKLPHKYYDENMLHAALITEVKDYNKAVKLLNDFLPYVDNWAVCDTMLPKAFKCNKKETKKEIKEKLLIEINRWIKSKNVYECRFGIEMLMKFYLDEDFKIEYLDKVSKIISNEYYINMMIAWYFATALTKKWDDTIPFIKNNSLPIWTHNKTIQKARESFRVSDKHKEYLNTLKR